MTAAARFVRTFHIVAMTLLYSWMASMAAALGILTMDMDGMGHKVSEAAFFATAVLTILAAATPVTTEEGRE